MYFKLKIWNARVGVLSAVALLISLLLQDGSDAQAWMRDVLNVVLVIVLIATVLLQGPLQKLALKESFDQVEGVSYEELVAQAQQQEQRNKR